MGILGSAIAHHLKDVVGLYSVELPESLMDDLVDLVSSACVTMPNRAVLVTDDNIAGLPFSPVRWREVLRWRTTDDRVFGWKRGAREPDTSFRSVVRPFISSRFPGAGGGECTPDMLVRLSIVELWRRRGLQPTGETFDAFFQTARWVTGVLRQIFEKAGSTSTMHWSDQYLQHWSTMLGRLDAGLAALGTPPLPRHAWEIVRLSGLPLPSPIVDGNPFNALPKALEEKEWGDLAELWADIVTSFVLRQGGMALLLAALDRGTVGANQINSWNGLPWQSAASISPGTPAPVVGLHVFGSQLSPSLLTPSTPSYPVASAPSWWGVSSNQLDEARRYVREETPLLPDTAGSGLLRLLAGEPSPYILNTRSGTVTHAHTQKKWRCRVTVDDIRLRFKESWGTLHYAPLEPASPAAGDAWIHPDNLKVSCKGGKESSRAVNPTAGGQLAITLGIQVEYTAALSPQTGSLSGTWNTSRSLKIELQVRRFLDGQWDAGRAVAEEIELIIPSPFSPTVLAATGPQWAGVAPDTQDEFTANVQSVSHWVAATTPTVLLKEEGEYDVHMYDGTVTPSAPAFTASAQPSLRNVLFGTATNGRFPSLRVQLDDGDLIANADLASPADIAVFNVKERSANLSSGLLSAVRGSPAGRKQPSTAARATVLGRYQSGVTRALCTPPADLPNSLFQYVISSKDVPEPWPVHPAGPEPLYLMPMPAGFSLPGLGAGPSAVLASLQEWTTFMDAVRQVRNALGLLPGAEETWLSGLDLSVVSASDIKAYADAHRELVCASRQASPTDVFWASYPFAVLVAEGRPGVSFGQLQAVLLSPLHPARLVWAYAATRIAQANTADPGLLGLLEGWNIPCTGIAFNPAGQKRQLVAVPTDPGPEQDFAAWSALAVLGDNGLADLPVFAAGQPLPWGGKTGINARVVERALRDYFVVHPHINSLELDIRSVSPAPRSQEIDEAVLALVGAGEADHIDELRGATRVWDSDDRQGPPPTRDRLFSLRGDADRDQPFEWRSYPAGSPPRDADIAIVENASVHLAIMPGTADGVLGLMPLRRFSPAALSGLSLDQHYRPPAGEDLLGLCNLLREIEATADTANPTSLRATPQLHALGIGQGARWEVIGTFNLDPTLLATLVASAATTGGTRLLWEWRPSWMSTDRKQGDLAGRPYYVVARIPASLLTALLTRQAFTTQNASELLGTLGQHGIGLAALAAEGGTSESAAAGFYYALRLLLPMAGTGFASRLVGIDTPSVVAVLPLDPAQPILQGLAGRKLDLRADLIAIAMRIDPEGRLNLCFVPIEVKHHGMPSRPEAIPSATDRELGHARQQVAKTAALIKDIATSLGSVVAPTDAASAYLKRLALATLLDMAISFTPGSAPVVVKAAILRAALTGEVSIDVGDGVLLWFAPGSMQSSGAACVVDRYGATTLDSTRVRELFIDPHVLPALWWTGAQPGPNENQVRTQVDDVLVDAFSTCAATGGTRAGSLGDALRASLGLGTTAAALSNPVTLAGQAGIEPSPPSQAVRANTSTAPAVADRPPAAPPPTPTSLPPDAAAHTPADNRPIPVATTSVPRVVVGWTAPASRWAAVGKLAVGDETVALDLDHPKTVGVYGYMGSGKSYLLGNLIESAVRPMPGVNSLQVPLAVVVFNYRRNASDRFELSSLATPNQKPEDVERLAREYGAAPAAVEDIHVLCLPGELRPARKQEYGSLPATELFFDPAVLGAEDWELLMGEPGSEAVFARTIRNTLVELRSVGDITLESLEQQVANRLTGQSRTAARLRFDFVRRYLSTTQGTNFGELLRPGRVLVVDLRQPLFNKEDALRFFLVCANQISKVQGQFNKMIVFDEAHEYMSDAFGERMESRIRLMRHEGTSYVFATQDVNSIPLSISRFLTTRFVFDLGTRENVQDLEQAAPDFRGFQLLGMRPGHCFVHASPSTNGMFARPREIRVRPRATQHGGASQIFSTNKQGEQP